MSARKTLLWTILLLALAVFYYYVEIEGEKKHHQATRQQELLLPFVVADVTTLTVKRPTETITAVKRAGGWHLTAPLSAPGDGQKYEALIRDLADVRFQRLIAEHPETLEPFGLTTPLVEIHVRTGEQSVPLGLRLGEKTPTGNGYYVQVEGRPAIYVISTTVKDALNVSLYDLREKTVMAFEPTDVHEVHVEFAPLPSVILQLQDNSWQLTTPVLAKADALQVQTLLQSLRDVKVQAFVSEAPADLEAYGLHAPVLRLAVVVGKDRSRITLLFGRLDADRKGVYTKRDDAANVFLLPQSFWDNLPRTLTALRDKTLLHYDRDRITRLELLSAENHTVIIRTGLRQYMLEQPVSAAGDGETIDRFLWALKELKAKDIVAEMADDLAAYGLAPPRFQVRLWEQLSETAQDMQQHAIHFGNAASETEGIYVRLAERPHVYLVDSHAAQRLMEKTAFDLRDKKLLPFDIKAVQKIRIQYPTSALTLERHRDSWRLSEPQQQAVRQRWKVDDLLYELSALEYVTLVTETVADMPGYGLDIPQVTIAMWLQDGTPVGPLAIGKTMDTGSSETRIVFAQAGPQAPLYGIRADFLDILPKTIADLSGE